jgi:NTP pyrophosphatase (non-canonical NTP hydrolase)
MNRVHIERGIEAELWLARRKHPEFARSHQDALAVLMEEVGEVARAILNADIDNLETELFQVAAVVTRWLEGYESMPALPVYASHEGAK